MPSPFAQSRYQVRLEHGADGIRRLGPAEVVVFVDVLDASRRAIDAVDAGRMLDVDELPADARAVVTVVETAAAVGAPAAEGAPAAGAPAPVSEGSLVVIAGLRNVSAVVGAVLARQARRGRRTGIAVVASAPGGRVAVENQLAAGAVVDALAARGIDHTSPEAAVACEGFRALRGAMRHMLTASGTGQELVDAGRREEVLAQARIDGTDAVPVLRDGSFARL